MRLFLCRYSAKCPVAYPPSEKTESETAILVKSLTHTSRALHVSETFRSVIRDVFYNSFLY
jgi:hypothetical protein